MQLTKAAKKLKKNYKSIDLRDSRRPTDLGGKDLVEASSLVLERLLAIWHGEPTSRLRHSGEAPATQTAEPVADGRAPVPPLGSLEMTSVFPCFCPSSY